MKANIQLIQHSSIALKLIAKPIQLININKWNISYQQNKSQYNILKILIKLFSFNQISKS